MAFYQYKRQLQVNASLQDIWNFIASPANLKKITPDYMGFDITSELKEDMMYEGMIISYKVSPLFGIKTTWVTEITKVKELHYFVDEQRIGPYKLWHHEHILKEDGNGVIMHDIVSYAPPFGFLGAIANTLIIRNKLNEIFDYREKTIHQIFL